MTIRSTFLSPSFSLSLSPPPRPPIPCHRGKLGRGAGVKVCGCVWGEGGARTPPGLWQMECSCTCAAAAPSKQRLLASAVLPFPWRSRGFGLAGWVPGPHPAAPMIVAASRLRSTCTGIPAPCVLRLPGRGTGGQTQALRVFAGVLSLAKAVCLTARDRHPVNFPFTQI